MELRNINQNLYVLRTRTIRHTDVQALPVKSSSTFNYINFSSIDDKYGGRGR